MSCLRCSRLRRRIVSVFAGLLMSGPSRSDILATAGAGSTVARLCTAINRFAAVAIFRLHGLGHWCGQPGVPSSSSRSSLGQGNRCVVFSIPQPRALSASARLPKVISILWLVERRGFEPLTSAAQAAAHRRAVPGPVCKAYSEGAPPSALYFSNAMSPTSPAIGPSQASASRQRRSPAA